MNKKNSFIIYVFLLFIIGLFNLSNNKNGNISKVKIINIDSKIYLNEEIESAIDVVLDYFQKYYKGCTLTEISYIGDEKNKEFISYARRNNKDEVIVLISTFETNALSSNIGLNPNSKYTNYNWILVKNKNGKWQHINHGY